MFIMAQQFHAVWEYTKTSSVVCYEDSIKTSWEVFVVDSKQVTCKIPSLNTNISNTDFHYLTCNEQVAIFVASFYWQQKNQQTKVKQLNNRNYNSCKNTASEIFILMTEQGNHREQTLPLMRNSLLT